MEELVHNLYEDLEQNKDIEKEEYQKIREVVHGLLESLQTEIKPKKVKKHSLKGKKLNKKPIKPGEK